MDWYLPSPRPSDVAELRRELRAHLGRHAVPGSDIAGAEVVISELLTNAVRHAPGPTWVVLDWRAEEPRLEVHDLGPGFELEDPALPLERPPGAGGHGLFLAAHLAPELAIAAKRAGGSRVTATLPVRRARERSYDAPPPASGALPSSEEVGEDGYFGREPFLRALVVQLAHAVEAGLGPEAIEAAVAAVGTQVGGRMEEEYRQARGVVGPLSSEQIGELLVGLKAAIGGDFWVISADEDEIVLGNRRCPFGDAVQKAPGLCRMTSSVFGGIAARNRGGGEVILEERIALGDPGCKVVIRLGARDEESGVAHRYASGSPAS